MTDAPPDLPVAQPPDPDPRPPAVPLPPGACDSHAHVFGPAARYPLSPARIYTPAETPLPAYLALMQALGITRGVLVQPSPYGADNRALLDAITGRENLRGVAVVTDATPERALESMHAAGVRGVRLNVVDTNERRGELPLDALARLAARIRPLGWHIELLAHSNEYPTLDRMLRRLPVEVVFDHLGFVATTLGPGDAGFQALLRLMRDGRAWVKLTAPYRISPAEHPFADVTPFAEALIDAAPDRVVWGTDWPHIKAEWRMPMPRDGALADLLRTWVPDPATAERILVANPARLYGFGA